jgi:hypothetical protein
MEKKICIWSEAGTKNGVGYSHAQYFIHNDGGRLAAGYKGTTGDCVTRAIAIVTVKSYLVIYNALYNLSEN